VGVPQSRAIVPPLPHIAILGAGPAGVAAAYKLRQRNLADVTVLERGDVPGGLASSFDVAGVRVDFGSHRLHPSCAPEILGDVRTLLGDDLLVRPRHGRIRLRGRWVSFPLEALDLARSLPADFVAGALRDQVMKLLPQPEPADPTFASVLERGLGATICRDFYFPYAEKIWGVAPEDLAATQARRRVQASSLPKLAAKVMQRRTGRTFFYPRGGFGQIATAYASAAERNGARILFGARATEVTTREGGASVVFQRGGETARLDVDHVWSTIPLPALARIASPAPDAQTRDAAARVRYRGMVLAYLALETGSFSAFDAHYFPERAIPITRLSEPKRYAARTDPEGRTVLCAEIPAAEGDAAWRATDDELGALVLGALTTAGIAPRARVIHVESRRVTHGYPIYDRGYQEHLAPLAAWAERAPRLLTLGRQGLFAHDNTHHTIAMAYAAVECLGEGGRFDDAAWAVRRRAFEEHVVED
jgi:protoporphyrinogen oxidase